MKPIIFKGVIDRFEGALAVIKAEANQELTLPKSLLAADFKEGSVINLTITDSANEQTEHETLAKSLLNEILNPNSNEEN